MLRQVRILTIALFGAAVTACATGTPQDPRVDRGLFSTIGGLSGDYENYTLQQLRALESEEREQDALERGRANLSNQEQLALRELDALEADLSKIRTDLSAIETRLVTARRSGSANVQQIVELEARLQSVRAEEQRLAALMQSDGAQLENLRQRRDALAREAEDLEALVETLGF